MIATLLPGPYTLVVPNTAGRFAWLCGNDPGSIGIRVPVLFGPVEAVLVGRRGGRGDERQPAGGPEPRRVGDIPNVLRDGVAVVVDGGELPGSLHGARPDTAGAESRSRRRGRRRPRDRPPRGACLNSHNPYPTETVG